MDETRLAFLQTPAAQSLLHELADVPLTPQLILKIRQRHPDHTAAAISELLELRRHARQKFSRADHMYFDRKGLEQATAEAVAAHHAARFSGYGCVADLCCGIGADALALATAGPDVIAVDMEVLKTKLTALNSAACGLTEKIKPVCADVQLWRPRVDAFYIDPDRRSGPQRTVSLADMQPSIDIVADLRAISPHIGVKVSPAVPLSELPDDCEFEVVSLKGDCKEAMLWFGDLKTAERRATILPGGHSLTPTTERFFPATKPPAQYLLEPDAAVIRAQLVNTLAAQLNATKIDPSLALLSVDTIPETPFAVVFRILDSFPFHMKRLKQWLQARDAGELILHQRGSALEPEPLRRQLKCKGSRTISLFLTQIAGQQWVFQVERVGANAARLA